MELVNEYPDCAETISLVAEDLLNKFGDVQEGWVILVGDGKSYRHLMAIKKQYSTALTKLLLFPGDWHILKNFQPILMKIYFAAGLREIAKNSGYNASTLKSLEQCSNFKRTHNFLLQVWEGMYREMLNTYFATNPDRTTIDASCILQSSIETEKSPIHTINRIRELVEDTNTDESFKNFVDQMCEVDKTWKLWSQFVFRDFLSYYGLYLSIRCSNWELRIACLKQMVPVFTAFDREYYARIIPDHLAQILQYPPTVLRCFEKGAFTVNLTGHPTRAIALDEAHEM